MWRLGGNTAVTYAEQSKKSRKFMAKVELDEHKVKAAGPRPFAHLKAKAFVNVVKDLTMWLQSIDAVQADSVSARRLSSSLALLGVNCVSLHIKNPVQSALLARAVVKASP